MEKLTILKWLKRYQKTILYRIHDRSCYQIFSDRFYFRKHSVFQRHNTIKGQRLVQTDNIDQTSIYEAAITTKKKKTQIYQQLSNVKLTNDNKIDKDNKVTEFINEQHSDPSLQKRYKKVNESLIKCKEESG